MKRFGVLIPLVLIAAIAWADSVHQYRPQPVRRVPDPLTRGILSEMDQTLQDVERTVNTVIPVSGGGSFRDSDFELYDDVDATKKANFQLSGITTGTTRLYALPNNDGTIPTQQSTQIWTGANTWSGISQFTNGTYFTDSVVVGAGGVSGFFTVDQTSGGLFGQKVSNSGLDQVIYLYDGTGNDYTIQLSGTPFSGSPVFTFPTAGGQAVTTTASQSLTSKVLATSCRLSCNSSGVAFQDNSSNTKQMKFDLSGITAGASRFNKWLDAEGTIPLAVAPTSSTTDRTGKTAAEDTTAVGTVYTTTHAGLYRITGYTVVTAFTAGGNIGIDVTFTDPYTRQANQNVVTLTGYAAVGDHAQGTYTFYSVSGQTIKFRTTFSGTATFSAFVRIEDLS